LVLFTVKTVTYNGTYAPRHVFAIWIVDGNNQYVTSLKVRAANYKSKLNKWKSYTNGVIPVDAISGATLTSHQQHTVAWNGKNTSGNMVTDGTYHVYVEFNETNLLSGNPYISVPFIKGTTSQTVTPNPTSYFQNIRLDFFAPTITGISDKENQRELKIYPNPVKDVATIELELQSPGQLTMEIFDLSGKNVHTFHAGQYGTGKHFFFWYPKDSGNLNGIFTVRCIVNGEPVLGKIIVK
jgi:flagellar hook assembly protein FlgD